METKRWANNPLLNTYDGVSVPVTGKDGVDYQMGCSQLAEVALKGTPKAGKLATVNDTVAKANVATKVIDNATNESNEFLAVVSYKKNMGYSKEKWYKLGDVYIQQKKHFTCILQLSIGYFANPDAVGTFIISEVYTPQGYRFYVNQLQGSPYLTSSIDKIAFDINSQGRGDICIHIKGEANRIDFNIISVDAKVQRGDLEVKELGKGASIYNIVYDNMAINGVAIPDINGSIDRAKHFDMEILSDKNPTNYKHEGTALIQNATGLPQVSNDYLSILKVGISDQNAMLAFSPRFSKLWLNFQYGNWNGWNELAMTYHVSSAQRVGPGRNIVTLLGASSVQDAFNKIHAMNGNYGILQLGDYIDLPTFTVPGVGEIPAPRNRVEICGFNHYDKTGATRQLGVLFQWKNVAFLHSVNPTHTNDKGYWGCQLRTLLNGDFATALGTVVGAGNLREVKRLAEKHSSTEWWNNWVTEKAFLPTEVEVWGHQVWGNAGYSTGTSIQWPIFALDPSRRCKLYNGGYQYWWTATSCVKGDNEQPNSTDFSSVGSYGVASGNSVGHALGVAPAFYI